MQITNSFEARRGPAFPTLALPVLAPCVLPILALLALAPCALSLQSAPVAVQSANVARDGSISEILPITGPGLATPASSGGTVGITTTWQAASVPPGLFLRAISMANATIGFASGELGVVLKTTDGGASWQTVLAQGFPHYYYGCQALSAQSIVVSGFDNQTGEGILRWSENGGASFGPPIVLPGPASGVQWLDRIEFSNQTDGLVSAAWAGGAHYTQTSGRMASDWSYRQVSSNWLSGTFTLLTDERAWIAGYDMASSWNSGISWNPLEGTSAIFDGPIAIHNHGVGVCGGGTISPTVSGWLHRTENGGHIWTSAPVANLPYPVRATMMLSSQRAYAAGGNVYSNVGGIWSSVDGGQQWTLEQPTSNELSDLEQVRLDNTTVRVFAAGYGSQIWYTDIVQPLNAGLISAAYGFCDESSAPCGNGYDSAGCQNLTGYGALLAGSGTSSIAADDLVLRTIQLPPNMLSVIFMGPNQQEVFAGNGLLVVGAGGVGLHRFPVHPASAGGVMTEGPGLAAYTSAHFPVAAQIQPGQTWNFQCYYRDPTGSCGFTYNFSNGFGVLFVP